MNKKAKATLAGIAVSLAALTATAVPAKPGIITMTQADGTSIEVRLVGDERAHQYFTPDGYLLVNNGEQFYFATVDISGRPVSTGLRADAPRTGEVSAFLARVDREQVRADLNAALDRNAESAIMRGPGLFPESRFPGMGKQKGLVILVEYTDVKFSLSDPHDYFNRMLNEPGFSDYGGTGSAHDFFLESSMGQFDCDFDVVGPVTLPNSMSYYGGNDWSGNDIRPAHMIRDACDLVDDEVDFSQYDRDGDGEIDNVFVFYAGRGEASGGSADTIWPHSWSATYGVGANYYDGKLLDRYACSNEWEGTRPDGVGTFVHEFSHVLGLPDLYATSYTNSFTPGAWSTMDYGPYNNNGCTPPLYSAFERYAMGWLEPVAIDGPMNATLPAIDSNIAGIIEKTPGSNEYFLFENRQQKGWDTYIPGHGMLIWHVDYNATVWTRNQVNNTPSHQYVDIEEADNSQSEYSRAGDSFPGTSNVTSFTDDTRPGMKLWNGTGFNLPITEIAENNGIITFKVAGGAGDIAAPVLTLVEYDAESVTIGWDVTGAAADKDLIISVYNNDPDDNVEYILNGFNAGRTGSYKIEGLEAQTEYVVTACLRKGLQSSPVCEPLAAYTGRPTLDRLSVEVLEAENIAEKSFVARWNTVEEANDYILTVYERVYGAPFRTICGFDLGTDVLPDGWSTSTPATYANTSYSGAAIPALRLGKGGDNVTSRNFDDGVKGVSYWHRGNGTSDEDCLAVMLSDGSTWTKYGEYPIVTAKGGATVDIDGLPEGIVAVRIDFIRNSGKGAVAIDDVEVRHGITYESVVLPAYDGIHTGDVSSYNVEGLTPGATYSYAVAATDGELVSRRSQEMPVTTKPASGIADALGNAGIRVASHGTQIIVSGLAAADAVSICDLTGRVLSSASADAYGNASLTVPATGLYLVRAGSAVVKTIVR